MNKKNLNIVSFATMDSTDNPDVLHFSGTVCYVDTPSDYTPHGGETGFKTIISSQNIDVDSLVGSGVNAMWGEWYQDWDLKDHDVRFKIGVIDKAWLEGNEVKVEGHLWKNDFPDVCDTIECAKDSLGFSVEAYFDGISIDKDAMTETGTGAHFTGVAVLYKSKAAFQKTKFMCSIKEDGMEKEEVQKLVDEKLKAEFSAFAEKQKKEFDELKAMFAKDEHKEEPKNENKEHDEPKTEEHHEEHEPKNNAEFAAMVSKAVADGIAQAMKFGKEEHEEPKRKTKVEFGGSYKQLDNKKKTVMEMSAEIDNDKSLTPEQRWKEQAKLWNKYRDEFHKM